MIYTSPWLAFVDWNITLSETWYHIWRQRTSEQTLAIQEHACKKARQASDKQFAAEHGWDVQDDALHPGLTTQDPAPLNMAETFRMMHYIRGSQPRIQLHWTWLRRSGWCTTSSSTEHGWDVQDDALHPGLTTQDPAPLNMAETFRMMHYIRGSQPRI